ncbi:MAG: hypothetical protein E7411_04385 [Ruminococcaceae bacterium]|nr:hypothetical protein [Oscillospiraceae bacterium]
MADNKLMYKDKPLSRLGNTIYYGDFSEKYIIIIDILEEKEADGKTVPSKLAIKLNQNCGQLSFKPVKKAERNSLYVALDLAEYWLKDALEMDP